MAYFSHSSRQPLLIELHDFKNKGSDPVHTTNHISYSLDPPINQNLSVTGYSTENNCMFDTIALKNNIKRLFELSIPANLMLIFALFSHQIFNLLQESNKYVSNDNLSIKGQNYLTYTSKYQNIFALAALLMVFVGYFGSCWERKKSNGIFIALFAITNVGNIISVSCSDLERYFTSSMILLLLLQLYIWSIHLAMIIQSIKLNKKIRSSQHDCMTLFDLS